MTDEILEYKPQGCTDSTPTMILMHGLGASGADLYPLAEILGGGQWRVLFPNAPVRAVTVNSGWQMPAWYDIAGANLEDRQDTDGILESSARIDSLLTMVRERGAQKIIVGGFSQGAAMAVHVGLRHLESLSGIIVLSGYMLLGENLATEAAIANRQTPIFMAHGSSDPVVLPQWAHLCRDALLDGGWQVDYHEYPAEHTIPPDAIHDLNAWLMRVG